MTPDMIVIHSSATPPKMDIGATEIDRWHRARGWMMIGYHFVIRRNGEIEIGRQVCRPGAHVRGHNAHTIGICMIGGVSEVNLKRAEKNFTPLQWPALRKLVDAMIEVFPGSEVVGHTDLDPKKKCPSFNVREWMKGPVPTEWR